MPSKYTSERSRLIAEVAASRILVFDGAMGTSIQALDLGPEDFGGEALEGCNEWLTRVKPEAILGIHREFLEAGADVIETNTFGSTPLVMGEYDLSHEARALSRESAELARRALEGFDTPDRPRFVAGSMGPTTRAISVTGGITFPELRENYCVQAAGLLEGGADLLILETSQDTLNVKAGTLGVQDAMRETGIVVPLIVSGTIEPMGTMLAGQGVEALYVSLEHLDLFAIGLNCATGPKFMTDHIRSLSAMSSIPVSCIPNAGLPDEDGNYNETPEMLSETLGRFAREGWLNIVGGCCGTTPAYTRALARAVDGVPPRKPQGERISRVSGIEYLSLEEENRPIIVGERTNVIGSRVFKKLIQAEDFEQGAEIARRQVRGGAHIIDICLADPDREEMDDMIRFMDRVTRKVKVPFMIDSTDAEVLEAALIRCQGKAVINSINLEDGEERFEAVVPLARRYGAALVVGCIDEDRKQGMAVTRERKLEVAERSHRLLTEKYGVPEQDIIFDPLVFPCATGDENYLGSAVATIEGVRAIKERFPRVKTILGISNVSFGLPHAGREVLNAVFLYHNVKAGLDLAIVNSEKLQRYASISEEEKQLSENLLWNRGDDPVAEFAAFYRDKKPKVSAADRAKKPLEERLADYIIEGSRDGLTADLDEILKTKRPLEIINGPLMTGMDEVGRLFNNNELIVAEVLQSAEAMKAAVNHLEPHMEKSETSSRGKVMLATVKGDVHDIGKNLVEIVLGNNGYEIVNLGIKIPPNEIIEAARKHEPDVIGLSGLLVKSAQQMISTAQDMRDAGVNCPVLVGGAALTKKFTQGRIAPEYEGPVIYCRDAMDGLEVVNQLRNPAKREALLAERAVVTNGAEPSKPAPEPVDDPAGGWDATDIPTPPDLKLHVVDNIDLTAIFPYINPQMLYAKHLGVRGSIERLREKGDAKTAELEETIESLKDEVTRRGIMDPRAVYRFFAAESDGKSVALFDRPGGQELARFRFPRQSDRDRLSLNDWVAPAGSGPDYLGMFVTTTGSGVRALADQWKQEGEYLKSYALQALAIEAAEGYAELLHQRMRKMWGFPDPDDMNQRDLFKTRYRGLRVSFGYPACPDLEDQAQLWKLLDPAGNIGVELTDGFMMEPEASVSALVLHHPQARYFSVREAMEV